MSQSAKILVENKMHPKGIIQNSLRTGLFTKVWARSKEANPGVGNSKKPYHS